MINLEQGLKERLHPNPNIKIKIVILMIARDFFFVNRTQILKVGRNQFTPNKDILGIYMHTECLISFLSLTRNANSKSLYISVQTGIKANAEFIVFYIKRKH